MSTPDSAIRAAKERLRVAVDRACIARGEALWTNGYRSGLATDRLDEAERVRLHQKEMAQLRHCYVAEREVTRAIAAYALAIGRTTIRRKGTR